MEFDLEYTLGLFPILLKYLGTTMEMALWGFVLALVLSLILATVRVFRVPALHWLAMLYISFFRGTPLLVQLFLLYYGLPQLFPIFVGMDAFTAAIIGLTLHFAAYMAESIRAAILGIHKSQMEAASSFKFFESFMAVALIYWVVVIFFTRLQHLLEVRLNRAY